MREGVLLVICLTLLVGVGVPALIYVGARRGGGLATQINLLRRAGKSAAQPWRPEEDNLKKLAEEVEKLQKPKENA